MRKKKSVISVDKLTLCYRATDEVINKLNEYEELIDSDDCFTLVRVPSDEALFANSFQYCVAWAMIKLITYGYISKIGSSMRSLVYMMAVSVIGCLVWITLRTN